MCCLYQRICVPFSIIFSPRIDRTMTTAAPIVVSSSTGGTIFSSIRWEVDKDSITNEFNYSPAIEVGGMQWRIIVLKTENAVGGTVFGVRLNRQVSERNALTLDIEMEPSLINHKDAGHTIADKVTIKALPRDDNYNWGYPNLAKWSTVTDKTKGFIKDNKLTVHIDFSLSNIMQSRIRRRIDITDENEPSHDITLVIEGKKIYVNKGLLSVLSPVFHTMFCSEFKEKDQKEIELQEIDHKEFAELMEVIYPPNKKVTDESVDYLLKLGDRFEIDTVIDQCEQFLIKSTKSTAATKLVFAGRYSLVELQIHCLDQLKTVKEVTNLRKSTDFKYFSEAIKVALFNKINVLTND